VTSPGSVSNERNGDGPISQAELTCGLAAGLLAAPQLPVAQRPLQGSETARPCDPEQWAHAQLQLFPQLLSLRKNPVTGPLPTHEKQVLVGALRVVDWSTFWGAGRTGGWPCWLEGWGWGEDLDAASGAQVW
jgi:hypothetical protein